MKHLNGSTLGALCHDRVAVVTRDRVLFPWCRRDVFRELVTTHLAEEQTQTCKVLMAGKPNALGGLSLLLHEGVVVLHVPDVAFVTPIVVVQLDKEILIVQPERDGEEAQQFEEDMRMCTINKVLHLRLEGLHALWLLAQRHVSVDIEVFDLVTDFPGCAPVSAGLEAVVDHEEEALHNHGVPNPLGKLRAGIRPIVVP